MFRLNEMLLNSALQLGGVGWSGWAQALGSSYDWCGFTQLICHVANEQTSFRKLIVGWEKLSKATTWFLGDERNENMIKAWKLSFRFLWFNVELHGNWVFCVHKNSNLLKTWKFHRITFASMWCIRIICQVVYLLKTFKEKRPAGLLFLSWTSF